MKKQHPIPPSFSPKYTLGFLTHQDEVLLIKREKEPNLGLYNGLGGKIDASDASHFAAMQREIKEEARAEVSLGEDDYYGVLTWRVEYQDNYLGGCHLFITEVSTSQKKTISLEGNHEGSLEWKRLDWVKQPDNNQVVSNIPVFLRHLEQQPEPARSTPQYYHFTYPQPHKFSSFQVYDIEL